MNEPALKLSPNPEPSLFSYQKTAPSLILVNRAQKKSLESSRGELCLSQQLSRANTLSLVSLDAFDSSADITDLPLQLLTTMSTLHRFPLLCPSLPLCLPLSCVCLFLISLFLSQTHMITMKSVCSFCKSCFLIGSRTNTAPTCKFPDFVSVSLHSCLHLICSHISLYNPLCILCMICANCELWSTRLTSHCGWPFEQHVIISGGDVIVHL